MQKKGVGKELKQKVVISSQTHVAIDNVLDELMENYDLIIPNRITNRRNRYSGEEIDSTLYKTWAKKFENHNKRARDQKLAKEILKDMANFQGSQVFRFSQDTTLADYSVLGATTTTSAIGGKKGLELLEGYDWLIIDEVSKCPITEVLRYLPYVEKIIMVGDDFQLAPLLEFTKADVEGLPSYDEDKFNKLESIYEKSVFANTLEKARETGRMIELNVNYRSVKAVLNAYNIFYDGRLQNMREVVKPAKVQFNDFKKYEDKDIFFVEVKNGKEAKEGTSRYNIEELEATLKISQKPILLTEGKTDAKILKVAWEKLFDYECPYDIKSCNLLEDDSKENAIAGAGILNKILCSTRYDSGRIVIGMFDNDKAGIKEFELDANYKFVNGKNWKEHKNKQGYAFVIPANDELKKIADVQNLSIEFLFDYEALQKEVDGKKLIMDKPKMVTRINGIEIEVKDAEDSYWYMSKIEDSSKTDFAFYVVPTLEKKKFENFREIFSTISEILEIVE